MTSRTVRFVVDIEQPEDASVDDMLCYITEAVGSWGGSLRPPGGYGQDDAGDPMFGSHVATVKTVNIL